MNITKDILVLLISLLLDQADNAASNDDYQLFMDAVDALGDVVDHLNEDG